MALDYIFYVISPSHKNAQSWLTLDKVIIRKSHIDGGHRPASGDIFDFSEGKQPAIIGILKDDVVATSILQHCFEKRDCLGWLTCATLKTAQQTMQFYLRGALLPDFQRYAEQPFFKPSLFIPASTETTAEPARKPIRGMTGDWRKTFKPPAPLISRPKPTRFIFRNLSQAGKYKMVMAARAARLKREGLGNN